MAALSDTEIFAAINSGELSVEPLDPDNVQLGSIDLTLAAKVDVLKPQGDAIDPAGGDFGRYLDTVDITGGYILEPGHFVTGHSAEHIRMPNNMNGLLANRNSMVRVGLDAAVSCYINPGFHGNKIIVVRNMGSRPLKLTPGLRICQLVIFRLGAETIRTYDSRHDTDELNEYIRQRLNADMSTNGYHMDTSLAEFMNQRIAEAARATQ